VHGGLPGEAQSIAVGGGRLVYRSGARGTVPAAPGKMQINKYNQIFINTPRRITFY
jgi:hypothetical protein